jgi:hypothetical protein
MSPLLSAMWVYQDQSILGFQSLTNMSQVPLCSLSGCHDVRDLVNIGGHRLVDGLVVWGVRVHPRTPPVADAPFTSLDLQIEAHV